MLLIDTNEVLVVETTTENDTQKPAELNSSKVSNDKKQTTTRRSRIKPVITPAPRRRKNTKEKEIDSTAESTPNAECSAENSPEKGTLKWKRGRRWRVLITLHCSRTECYQVNELMNCTYT